MTFSQDPWRPGAAVPPAVVEPVRKDPPKQAETQPAETPQGPANAVTPDKTPAETEQDVQDELERALAQMRGDA